MMTTIPYPEKSLWEQLCKRPELDSIEIEERVDSIFEKVQEKGDTSLFEYAKKFDNCVLDSLSITDGELKNAEKKVSPELQKAIKIAFGNITTFHKTQMESPKKVTTSPGVHCWRKSVPIETVGLYIPGGTAPLFSSLLMLGIPAKIAGSKNIVVCTPPQPDGTVHPAILYTAELLGITNIYKVGGAQAIAAMGFGTETIPKVSKIFGPGNQYVTLAKQKIQQHGVAIDMPAGPSEVLVYADETAVPEFVAADLLSQAEHGPDSQVILATTDEAILPRVYDSISSQLNQLPRKEIAEKALQHSRAVLFSDVSTAMEFSNYYAPEHLIIASEIAEEIAERVINAGSVFLGNYSCESVGDYASGTNHTLPTNGFAKAYSGVSVDSFVKKVTFQSLSAEGLLHIGPTVETMAGAEGLEAHKNAVSIRLKNLRS